MKKILIYSIVSLVFVSLILITSALSITNFSGQNSSVNLTFSGNENQTLNISIPRYSNVTSATMNLSGINNIYTQDEETSYNTFINIYTWGFYNPYTNAVDENWDSSAGTSGVSTSYNLGYMIIDENYTLNDYPSVVSWKFKAGFTGAADPDYALPGCTEISYWNYTLNDWQIFGSSLYDSTTWSEGHNYGSQCYNLSSSNCENFIIDGYNAGNCTEQIPLDGISGNNIKTRVTMKQEDVVRRYFEGALIINQSYPYNLSINLNNTQIWAYNGVFNQTNNKTTDFSSTLNSALNNGACDCIGCSISGDQCIIPVTFHTTGILQISDLNIKYDAIPKINLISPSNNSFSSINKNFSCNASQPEPNLINLTLDIFNSTQKLNSTFTQTNISNRYEFDGVNDFVNITDNGDFNFTNQFSIALWIKLNLYQSYDRIAVKSHTSSNPPYTMYGLLLDSNSTGVFDNTKSFRMEIASNGRQHFVRSTSGLTEGAWYFITGTFNISNGEANLYLNGTLDNSTLWNTTSYSPLIPVEISNISGDSIQTNSEPFTIGAAHFGGSPGNYINGIIDEVRIYNRTLNATEVSQLYALGRFNETILISDGLVGLYHFNNDTDAIDSSGNSNDGVLNGNLTYRSFGEINYENTFNASGVYTWQCSSENSKGYYGILGNNTLTVDITNPVITPNYPLNNSYLNTGNNINLNCTVEGVNLDSVFLYGNFTGSYLLNQTITSISSGVENAFNSLNLTDNPYIYTCGANKSVDPTVTYSQYGNYTFTIDTINPNTSVNSITSTAGSQTISFNATSIDINLDTCKYTIYNSSGGVDGLNSNVSFTCNSNPNSATTTSYGTFTLRITSTDLAGNVNYSQLQFITSASSGGTVGGGGGGSSTNNILAAAIIQPDQETNIFTNLSRAIMYARVNESCNSKKICVLTDLDKQTLVTKLNSQQVPVSLSTIQFWIDNFNDGLIDAVIVTLEQSQKYDLVVSGISILENPFRILSPLNPDLLFLAFTRDTTSFNIVPSAEIKNCTIISGDIGFSCENNINFATLNFKVPEGSTFTSRIFSAEISLISQEGDVTSKVFTVRVIRLTFTLIISVIIVSGLVIFGYIKRKEISKFFKRKNEK